MRFATIILCFFLLGCAAESSKSSLTDEYYPTYTKNLEDSVQTLELTYIDWACECANWITETDIKKAQENKIKITDQSIFIEPADSTIDLPDTLGYSGDLIRLSGQFYKEKGYPKKYLKTEMQVEKSRVFRFTKYEVLKSNYRDFITDTTTKTEK